VRHPAPGGIRCLTSRCEERVHPASPSGRECLEILKIMTAKRAKINEDMQHAKEAGYVAEPSVGDADSSPADRTVTSYLSLSVSECEQLVEQALTNPEYPLDLPAIRQER
jgi:hypothetical protein